METKELKTTNKRLNAFCHNLYNKTGSFKYNINLFYLCDTEPSTKEEYEQQFK